MSPHATTRWSLIARAAQPSVDRGAALAQLCADWRPAIVAFLDRHSRVEEAQDLTQAFLLHFLEHALVARADPQRGRFRSFLYTALRHWLLDQQRRESALMRAAPVAPGADEMLDETDPAREFDRDWARLLLDRALRQVRDEALANGRAALFREAAPFLLEAPEAQDYAASAQRLGLRANTFASAVMRLRQRLRAAVRAQLADITAGPDDLERELRWLKESLRDC